MALSTVKCPFCSSTLRREMLRGREVLLCTKMKCLGYEAKTPTVFQVQNGKPVRDPALERLLIVEQKRQARIEEDDG